MWRLLWQRFLREDDDNKGEKKIEIEPIMLTQCLKVCSPRVKTWMFFMEDFHSHSLFHLKILNDPSLSFFEEFPFLYFFPSINLKKHNIYHPTPNLSNMNQLLRKMYVKASKDDPLSTPYLCELCSKKIKSFGDKNAIFGEITENKQMRLYLTDFRGYYIKTKNVHRGNIKKVAKAWFKRYPLFKQSCLKHANTDDCKKYSKDMPLNEVETSCTLQNFKIMYEEDTIYHFWYQGKQIGSMLAYKKYGSLKDYLLFTQHNY